MTNDSGRETEDKRTKDGERESDKDTETETKMDMDMETVRLTDMWYASRTTKEEHVTKWNHDDCV